MKFNCAVAQDAMQESRNINKNLEVLPRDLQDSTRKINKRDRGIPVLDTRLSSLES